VLQVAEVAFINQLLEEDKKLSLLQKLKDGGCVRAIYFWGSW
jgi:hypothetical protein